MTITVTAVNDAPVADDDAYTTDEDTPLTVAAAPACWPTTPTPTANAADRGAGQPARPRHASPSTPDGSFTYTPAANYSGTDSLHLHRPTTAAPTSNTATVTITVNAVNDAPVADDRLLRHSTKTPR